LCEQSARWVDEETGQRMRCRFDKLHVDENAITELKTDQDLEPTTNRNKWRWYDWGYHRKAAIYLDAAYAIYRRNFTFRYVMVENNDDPRVTVWRIDTDSPAAEIGREETQGRGYRDVIREIQRCRSAGDWHAQWERGEQPFPLPEPVLARAEFEMGGAQELTMGGEPIGGL
jgi:hypothetical protein